MSSVHLPLGLLRVLGGRHHVAAALHAPAATVFMFFCRTAASIICTNTARRSRSAPGAITLARWMVSAVTPGDHLPRPLEVGLQRLRVGLAERVAGIIALSTRPSLPMPSRSARTNGSGV